MSAADEKKYSERELIEAKREGAEWVLARLTCWQAPLYEPQVKSIAAKLFPLPKVTRPRVVRWHNYEYKLEGGMVQQRHCPTPSCRGGWFSIVTVSANSEPRYLRMIADLLENPTELVEDSGGSRADS